MKRLQDAGYRIGPGRQSPLLSAGEWKLGVNPFTDGKNDCIVYFMYTVNRLVRLFFDFLFLAALILPAVSLQPSKEDQVEKNEGNADVLFVKAVETSEGVWTFYVTVSHPDRGWKDYADGWDVVTEDGSVLKPDVNSPFTRLLLHPHEDEQPFTWSQSGTKVLKGTSVLTVRAHDIVDGFGGKTVTIDLNVTKGENYEIQPLGK